jgi:L-cysteate sulfo-lyase
MENQNNENNNTANNNLKENFDFLQQKENFAFLPTPLCYLENLSKKLNHNIYIKRDDMTGLALGGNKTRKLEYLMQEAIKNKHDTIITVGSIQSNHARQTAAASRLFKLDCYLILISDKSKFVYDGNVLLDKILGAEIIFCENEQEGHEKLEILLDDLKNKGKNPYFIPAGGSNEIGALGYVNAFKEILNDEKKIGVNFDYIFFASSSLGTHSGLLIGNKLFKQNKKIYGISICKNFLDSKSNLTDIQKLKNLISQFSKKYDVELDVNDEDIIYDERFNEKGYAVLSEDDQKAIEYFAQEEAIILDPVYSGRAAAGMIKMIEDGEIEKDKNILFIHTGGAPALFSKSVYNYYN